jgi:hypothetical protein
MHPCHAPFTVDTIDTEGVVLLLAGASGRPGSLGSAWRVWFRTSASPGGVIDTGGRHAEDGRSGTLDGYLNARGARRPGGLRRCCRPRASSISSMRDLLGSDRNRFEGVRSSPSRDRNSSGRSATDGRDADIPRPGGRRHPQRTLATSGPPSNASSRCERQRASMSEVVGGHRPSGASSGEGVGC